MNCILKCPGGSAMGQPSKAQSKPLREYLVDNEYYYRLVLKHLRFCKICDPAAILEVYLERRRTMPKFHGQTSLGLIKLARRYAGLYTGRKLQVPPSVLAAHHETLWRSGDPTMLLMHEKSFTWSEFFESAQIVYSQFGMTGWENWHKKELSKKSVRYGALFSLMDAGAAKTIDEDDFRRLVDVFEIQTS